MFNTLTHRLTARSVIGLDLGSSRLKAVEVESTGGRLMLRRCVLTPPGATDTASALAQLLREARLPAAARVAVGLASPEVVVKALQFPPMPKKELAGAIQLEAEQAILNGHTMSEMVIDWHPLPARDATSLRGVLAVVPRTILLDRLQPVRAAGLRPAVVDVEGLALWNAYWTLVGAREGAQQTVLLVNVGERTTNLVIAKGPDELILMRDLALGAHALREDSRRAEWAAEVRDSVSYARSQAGLRALDAVYATGGGSGPSLVPLLQTAAPAPVTCWDPLQQLARDAESPSVEEGAGPLLAIAIGLALRQPT